MCPFIISMAPTRPPFHPRRVAVLHFSLMQLCCDTLACQEHSAPWEVSHMCAQGRSCSPQSCVKITVIVVSLGCKRIISSPMILNVYRSHFNWFPKHRLPWNWSILCLWGAGHTAFPSVTRQEEMLGQWELLEERWLWCFLGLWKYSFLILSKQLQWEWWNFFLHFSWMQNVLCTADSSYLCNFLITF